MDHLSNELHFLRQRAERMLNAQNDQLREETLSQVEALVHELQLRELELQIQNEDLQVAQQDLETLHKHYLDLYHQSPVGYITLNEEGIILDVNETGGTLLGVDHRSLPGTLFARFIERIDQEQFYFYFKTLIESQTPSVSEIRLIRNDRSRFYAQLQSIAVPGKDNEPTQYRFAVSDVTQHRQGNLITLLLKAGQHLTGVMDVNLLLTILVSAVIETLPTAESALLWLYDEQKKKLVVRTWAGKGTEEFNQLVLEPNQDIVGLLYTTGQGRIFNDLSREPAHESTGNLSLDLMRSAIGVPLHLNGKIIGVLMAYRRLDMGTFVNNDLFLLEALATQISLVMQSADFIRQISSAHEQLRFLTHKVVSVQEDERRRISRELHDEAGQTLTMLKLDLQTVRRAMPAESHALSERLDRSIELVEQTGQRIRELSYLLRPPTLDTLRISDVLGSYCEDFAARSSLPINFQSSALPDLMESTKITLYRFVQEALTNVARHAEAKSISVSVEHTGNTLIASVTDDGVGFEPQAEVYGLQQPRGIGLIGVQERLAAIGGRLEIVSRPGDGTTLRAYLPLAGEKS